MLLSLFLSFVCTNFVNPYLLVSQRSDRKMAISHHAAHSRRTHIIYFLGHFFGGLFFLIFARLFFYQELGSNFLWLLSIGGAVSEWLQALFPAKGRYELLHQLFAWSMAIFMSVILIAAPIIAGIDGRGAPALTASLLILLSCAAITLKVKIQKFWIPQVLYFFAFYIVMVILAV